MKKPWNILICILFKFGCSVEIAVEDNETTHAEVKEKFIDESNGTFYYESNWTFYDDSNETLNDELNQTSENLTTFGYEIAHFNDKNAEVRNAFERQKDFKSYPIQVIVNSTEWEITLNLHDFDEFWMRNAIGRGFDIVIFISAVHRNNSGIREC